MSSTSSSLSPPPSPTPSPPPSVQPTNLLASSLESPEEMIRSVTTLSAQAGLHLRASEQPNDFYESALDLMQVVQIISYLIDRLLPNQYAIVLQYGTHGGRIMLNVLAAEMFSINIQLCIAFLEIGMWELVEARVSAALELAAMSGGRFYVSEEAMEWLREMGETAEEQVRIDNGDTSALEA